MFENNIIDFIHNCHFDTLSFHSVLIVEDYIDILFLKELYDVYYIDDGKHIQDLIKKATVSNIINAFSTHKKKILF